MRTVGEAGVGHSASPFSLAVWFDISERPPSWPLTPANALHAERFRNAHDQPVGLISARPFLLPRWNVLFHGPLPGSIWTFHSILSLAHRASRLSSWNAALSLMGREAPASGQGWWAFMLFTLELGTPWRGRSCLRSPLISFSMSSCFSLSSSDKNCQGRFPSWNLLLSLKLRPRHSHVLPATLTCFPPQRSISLTSHEFSGKSPQALRLGTLICETGMTSFTLQVAIQLVHTSRGVPVIRIFRCIYSGWWKIMELLDFPRSETF